MKKHTLYFLLIICSIVVFNIVLLYQKNETSDIIEYQNAFIQEQNTGFEILKNILWFQLNDNGKPINVDAYIWESNNDSTTLRTLADNENKLILYLPGESCHNCLDNILAEIKEHISEEFLDEIIFISFFENNEDHQNFEETYNLKTYNLKQNYLGLQVERINTSYFMFVLEPVCNTCTHLFIVDNTVLSMLPNYFRLCKKKLKTESF